MVKYINLMKLCKPKQWKTIATKDLIDKGYPVYGANGIIGYYNSYTHKDPTLMITCRGATCGTINLSVPYSYINGNAMALDDLDTNLVDLNYLCHYLKYRGFNDVISGSAQPQITRTSLANVVVPIFDIKIQRNIANILDQAQELIDKRKAQIEALDELIQSVFYDMFGDRFNNSSTLLSCYIDIIGGYAFSSKGYSEKGIPIVKIGTVNKGYFDEENLSFWENDDQLIKYELYPGDLVITLTGTVGKDDYGNVLLLSDKYEKYYLNQRVAKLKIKDNDILNKLYLLYTFKQPEIKRLLTKNSRGIRQANIANQDIYNLQIFIPPIELQNHFAEIVENIEKQKALLNESLVELENNFNSLMQRAFNGEPLC